MFQELFSFLFNTIYYFWRQPTFKSQDLISNSPYCLPHSSYDVSFENFLLDQLIIP